MEVQTAARALEAAGPHGHPHGDRRARLSDAAPVLDAAHAALGARRHLLHVRARPPALREAIAAHYRDHYGVDVAPERVIVTAGSSAALLLVMALLVDRDDEILLADPGYPCNRHFVRVLEGGRSASPSDRSTATSSMPQSIARPLDAANARRADRLAVEPDRNADRTQTSCEASSKWSRVAARHLIVDEIYLGLVVRRRAALRARALPTSCSSSRASRSTST